MTTGSTQDKFMEDISEQMKSEKSAYNEYQALARFAEGLGYGATAKTLRAISEDEKRHHILLGHIADRLSYTSGLPEAELKRPFPQVYDEWADLGIDIGAKDPSITDEVQTVLTHIYAKTPSADEAKRWLIQKAGELGVT